MATDQQPAMTDDRRALLTDREREILLGNADVTDKYRGVVISRVRNKIGLLDQDLPALEAHDTLADELREVVCGDQEGHS